MRSVWGIHVFPIFHPIQWGAGWSYLEFPKHLILTSAILGVSGYHFQISSMPGLVVSISAEELRCAEKKGEHMVQRGLGALLHGHEMM